ncbi:hypothetical protein [uncultured Chitinophaga sp.]|uniref:hypothetical protein n=1 Tax=uncultured Chitinophaga sp. TaxID=339340 RepID=UPI0025F2240F|nr:hypothetical protein [uncultured Chitinophaga sp.]
MFLFGKAAVGTLYLHNNQCIKTDFILIGFPVFPVASYYQLSQEKGIPIPLHLKSVLYAYGRNLLPLVGLVMMLTWPLQNPLAPISPIIPILGLLILALSIFCWFTARGPKPDEVKVREALEKAIGYNMLPQQLPEELRTAIFDELILKVNKEFGFRPLEEILVSEEYNTLLYCAAYYMDKVQPNSVTSEFLQKHQL